MTVLFFFFKGRVGETETYTDAIYRDSKPAWSPSSCAHDIYRVEIETSIGTILWGRCREQRSSLFRQCVDKLGGSFGLHSRIATWASSWFSSDPAPPCPAWPHY